MRTLHASPPPVVKQPQLIFPSLTEAALPTSRHQGLAQLARDPIRSTQGLELGGQRRITRGERSVAHRLCLPYPLDGALLLRAPRSG